MSNSYKSDKTDKIIVFDLQNDSEIPNTAKNDIRFGSYFTREILIKKMQDLRIYAREIQDYKILQEIKSDLKELQSILDSFNKNDSNFSSSI